jgi:hypothetical protein
LALAHARAFGAPGTVAAALRVQALVLDDVELLADAERVLSGSAARLSTPARWSISARRCADTGSEPAAANRWPPAWRSPTAAAHTRSPSAP